MKPVTDETAYDVIHRIIMGYTWKLTTKNKSTIYVLPKEDEPLKFDLYKKSPEGGIKLYINATFQCLIAGSVAPTFLDVNENLVGKEVRIRAGDGRFCFSYITEAEQGKPLAA